MSHNIQIHEYKLDKPESMIRGLFVFIKRTYRDVYRFITKKRAERRVQKMLKSNFVNTEVTKKARKQLNNIKIVQISNRYQVFGISKAWRGIAAVFAVSFLMLTIITSQYYGPQFIEAEVMVQNFTESTNVVKGGIELLKYDTRSVNDIDDKVEFDAGTYTNGNFETGEDDLVAVIDTDDFLTIGSYGDNVVDTSSNDWWVGSKSLQTCSAVEFNNGNYSDTQWDGTDNWVELDATGLTNSSGQYISEVIDAGSNTVWSDLLWTSTRPTYKELPNNKGVETAYSAGNVDMTNNELLMHFNESGGVVADSSGNGFTGTPGATTTYGAVGRFNDALDFSGGGSGEVVIDDSAQPLNYTDVISYGVWFKADTFRNWAGLLSRMSSWGNGYNLQVGTTQRIACGAGGAYTNSNVMPVANEWYHAMCVYDGVDMMLYVNGELQTDTDVITLSQSTSNEINIGEFYTNGSSLDFDGQIDEVMISHEALSSSDVMDLYRRGANRLKFQVRSCDDSACAGESFIGPDGTGATHYTELDNNTVGLPNLTLTNVTDNQYFQYRTDFETDNNATSPELSCVSLNQTVDNIWTYRKCFDVDHTNGSDVNETEYQIYLDMDTSTLVGAGKMNANGDDLRFVDTDENVLSHFVADDMNTTSTRVWLQMDNIDAGTTEEICMYYGNSTATNISSREDVFTYTSQEEIYHVVADTAEATVTEFVSYTDNNNVNISTYNQTLNQYNNDSFPSGAGPTFTQTTGISTTHPINGTYNVNGVDNLVPASFASENFIYRMDRYTNHFSFISPWCSADVEVRNETDAIVTNGSFTIAQGTHHNLITDNAGGTGLANNDAVMIEVTNGCPILAQHHSNVGGDSFVMAPAAQEWYGVGSGHFGFAALYDNTNITVYRSDNTSVSYILNRGENVDINDSGSEGSDPAHRVVADNLIGVSALADSDGGEAVTFLPVGELGYKYYFPEDIQYIAIATKENTTTTVDLYHDGAKCGVGVPDDTTTVTSSASYPGKVYFGSTTDGLNIPAGACIVADRPIYAYDENAAQNDEHNAWNETQNKQFIYPTPTYSSGTVESGSWSIDGTNSWTRRIPVTINNIAATVIEDYQILIDLGADASSLFGNTQNDGGDIRVAGSI